MVGDAEAVEDKCGASLRPCTVLAAGVQIISGDRLETHTTKLTCTRR